MKPISTINVVELKEGEIISLYSFPNSDTGHESANNLFRRIVADKIVYDAVDEDFIDICIQDGCFLDGLYALIITHSNIKYKGDNIGT
jgi:hypothetical protein